MGSFKIKGEIRGGISIGNCMNASAIEDLHQAQVVRKVDNATHRINHYPVDSVVCLPGFASLSTLIRYRVSDLSAGYSVIRPLNNRGQECIPQGSVSRRVYPPGECILRGV